MSKPPVGTRVQVAVRIRPINTSDGTDERVAVRVDPSDANSVLIDGRPSKPYSYDHVFTGGQEELYAAIGLPMLEEAYKGFNVCLFAYGQTGSGKTYSIQGDDAQPEHHGIVPRFVRDVFQQAQKRVEEDPDVTIKISISMIEIYMEKVRDLLTERVRGQEPPSLEIHEDQQRRVFVKNVGLHSVLSADRVMQLLRIGNSNRQTAETRMNEASSRSHSIVQLTISQLFSDVSRKDTESLVSLVDLAGSERQGKSETTGQQFEEAKKINQSLLMLGRALNSFSEGRNDFISLRDSKLTRLLSESFGGNSKTWMLATISPAHFNLTESLSTLDYAMHAKSITNRAEVNQLTRLLELKDMKDLVGILKRKQQHLDAQLEERDGEIVTLQHEKLMLAEAVQIARREFDALEALYSVAEVSDALRKKLQNIERLAIAVKSVPTFVGACSLSLEGIVRGERRTLVLPLVADGFDGLQPQPTLNVQLFPRPGDYFDASLSFFVNVVGADNIPEPFAARTFCKLTLSHDFDGRWYKSGDVVQSTAPKYCLLKHFEVLHVTQAMLDVLQVEDVLQFQVFGFSE